MLRLLGIPIGVETAQAAAVLIRAYEDHARIAFNLMDEVPVIKRARSVLEWIVRSGVEETTVREVLRAHRGLQAKEMRDAEEDAWEAYVAARDGDESADRVERLRIAWQRTRADYHRLAMPVDELTEEEAVWILSELDVAENEVPGESAGRSEDETDDREADASDADDDENLALAFIAANGRGAWIREPVLMAFVTASANVASALRAEATEIALSSASEVARTALEEWQETRRAAHDATPIAVVYTRAAAEAAMTCFASGHYAVVAAGLEPTGSRTWTTDELCASYLEIRLGSTYDDARETTRRIARAARVTVLAGVSFDDATTVQNELVALGCNAQVVEGLPERVRLEVWQRDEGKCVDCGSRERLHFDHIVPVSEGGSSTTRNLELRCESCSLKRGAKDLVITPGSHTGCASPRPGE
jgi:hypothetical protein